MIASLKGKLLEKKPDEVIIDVGGVGYSAMISLSTHHELGELGEEVFLWIHTHVREDSLQLVGFSSKEEKSLFLLMRTVSGIGNRTALNVLSTMNPTQFIYCIQKADISGLISVPGIGKKTAERVIVELKDKVKDMRISSLAISSSTSSKDLEIKQDLHSALINMGYKSAQVEKVLANLQAHIDDGKDLGTLLRLGLKELSS